jgi:uncharacterized protein (DUF427 family)
VPRLTFFLRFTPSRRKAAQVVVDFARRAAYARSSRLVGPGRSGRRSRGGPGRLTCIAGRNRAYRELSPQTSLRDPTDEELSVRAIWNGKVIAESDDTVVVEGNHYFPREAVDDSVLVDSSTHTTCPWKGEASYFSLEVDGESNRDAAWFYPRPKSAAAQIKDRVAFWRGVTVTA